MTQTPQSSTHTGRKVLLSLGFIFASIIYAFSQRSVNAENLAAGGSATTSPAQAYQEANRQLLQTLAALTATTSTVSTPTSSQSATAPQQSSSGSGSSNTGGMGMGGSMGGSMMRGQYTDGSYTGGAADAYYGTVQVEAIVKNGQLADVKFLQYPNSHQNSIYINSQAMPLLTQEAVQAQSAQVSGVSGATFTSQAFIQSLSSALTQAKA